MSKQSKHPNQRKSKLDPSIQLENKKLNVTENKSIVNVGKTDHDKKKNSNNTAKKDDVNRQKWWSKGSSQENGLDVVMSENDCWFDLLPPWQDEEAGSHYRLDKTSLFEMHAAVSSAFDAEAVEYKRKSVSSSRADQKWIQDVIHKGTLSDRVAALALLIQESPMHELPSLDMLIELALKKEQRTSQLALEALKDLLLHNLLPNRRLKSFMSRPFGYPQMNMKYAKLFYFEDQLLHRIDSIITALDTGFKSTLEYFKRICMDIAVEWLIGKPEGEMKLLTLLVNKLGDPSGQISSKASDLLLKVIDAHQPMNNIIVREVRQLIYFPDTSARIVFRGVTFLSQVRLNSNDTAVAASLVECYISLFELAIKQEESSSRLLVALFKGINKALPYLADKSPIAKHLDSIFRIVHTSSFSTATRALVLLSHVVLSSLPSEAIIVAAAPYKPSLIDFNDKPEGETKTENEAVTNRFYRALYSKLLCDEMGTRTHNTLFLNLLYRSMKRDPSDRRILAFLRCLALIATHSTAAISASLLFLISETCKARPSLLAWVMSAEAASISKDTDDDADAASGIDWQILSGFNATKREPIFSVSAAVPLWESALLAHHFHPSVAVFSKSFISEETKHSITYSGDPTVDFSLTAFLNRFTYKNPKQNTVSKQHTVTRAMPAVEVPLNTSDFLSLDAEKVAPDKAFFHQYFGARTRLMDTGKLKSRNRKRRDSGDDDDDDAGSGSDVGEFEIDKYADKLAEEMLRGDDVDGPDIDDEDDDLEDFPEDDGDMLDDMGGADLDEGLEADSLEDEEAPAEDGDVCEEVKGKSLSKKKDKRKRKHDDMDDFADAADYEDVMEDIVSKKLSTDATKPTVRH